MAKQHFFIYLASRSLRRQEILKKMGIPFKVVSSRYQERWSRRKPPEVLSVYHALGKAQKAILPSKARFVLGGDTIVWHQGHGLGKPKNRAEALRMIRALAGTKHAVYTGLALLDRKAQQAMVGCVKTDVWIKPFAEDEIREYVDAIQPFDKAGSYAIQARIKIVKKISGSYSNVVGLPKELLRKMLRYLVSKKIKIDRQERKVSKINRK